MILNRNLKPSIDIEKVHIIAAAIFSANEENAVCIDFVCTGKGFYSYGYGTLILHMAQVFGMEYNLNHQKIGSISILKHESQETYLCCEKTMTDYYSLLGFANSSIDDFINNQDFIKFSERMNIKDWENDEPGKRLTLMSIKGKVPRQINFVDVVKEIDIEHSLYDNELFQVYKTLKPSKQMRKAFRDNMDLHIQSIQNHTRNEKDLELMNSSSDFMDFFKYNFNEQLFFKIGKWFSKAFDEEIRNFDQENFMESQTMLIAIEHLEMQFYPNSYKLHDMDTSEQWLCLRCSLCQKKCLKKNGKREICLFSFEIGFFGMVCSCVLLRNTT